MSFSDFCAIQFIGGRDKEQFKRWLGQRAAESVRLSAHAEVHTEAEWLALFDEWLRDTPHRAVRAVEG